MKKIILIMALAHSPATMAKKVTPEKLIPECDPYQSAFQETLCARAGGKVPAPEPISKALEHEGVEKSKMDNYLKKAVCYLAATRVFGITSDKKVIVNYNVGCMADQTVNAGSVNESKGCTFFVYDTHKNTVSGIGQHRNGYPQVKEKCKEGGLRKLINKDWGGMTVGEIFLAGYREIGMSPDYFFAYDEAAIKVLNDMKVNKGKTSLKYVPTESTLDKMKKFFNY